MNYTKVLVVGGAGFIGRHVVNLLAARGIRATVPTRRRERAKHLILLPTVEVIETNVNALAEAIGHALDRPIEISHIDRRDIDNIRRRVVNIEKIRRMLHWAPQITLDRGLGETARWLAGGKILSVR